MYKRQISARSMRGCSTMVRRVLAPMAVFVLSSTHRREPRFCFSLRVSVSSRFLRLELSMIMYLPMV